MANLTLLVCAVVPAIGIVANVVWPPDGYAYLAEQAALLLLSIISLRMARYSATAAIVFYFSLALYPVLAMVAHYAESGRPVLICTPVLGVVVVGLLTQHAVAVTVYTTQAIIASILTGVIYNDDGLGGALGFFCLILALALIAWCRKRNLALILDDAIAKTEDIGRDLAEVLGGFDE